jgi:hypothetical protein
MEGRQFFSVWRMFDPELSHMLAHFAGAIAEFMSESAAEIRR